MQIPDSIEEVLGITIEQSGDTTPLKEILLRVCCFRVLNLLRYKTPTKLLLGRTINVLDLMDAEITAEHAIISSGTMSETDVAEVACILTRTRIEEVLTSYPRLRRGNTEVR